MTVAFRNVDVDAAAPVTDWPYEAIVTVIERGTLDDWLMLTREFDRDPWGPVSRQVEECLAYEAPYGVAPLLERAIARARSQATARERTSVAAEVAALVAASGLSMADLAGRVGTSRSRLSTYRSGAVTPSAAFLVRLRTTVDGLSRIGSPRVDRPLRRDASATP